jgi:hypothetical protein
MLRPPCVLDAEPATQGAGSRLRALQPRHSPHRLELIDLNCGVERMNTFGSGIRTLAGPALSARILVGFLIGFYVLLPLDHGFPRIPVFGRPLNAAIAATLAVLFVLVVQSRGAVLAYLREPYSRIQVVYTGVLVLEAFRAPSLLVALHWTTLYFCTFLLNYVILRHVTRLHGVGWFSTVTVAMGVAAAFVSIVQAVVGMPLPMYRVWFEQYAGVRPMDYTLAAARADGTMNNPILYCVLMALVIPYALDVKNTAVRAVVLFTIMFAAGLSGSRTAVFVVGVFAAGAVVVYRWGAVRALPAVGLGLVLLTTSLGLLNADQPSSRVDLMVDRIGLLVDPSATTGEAESRSGGGSNAAAEGGSAPAVDASAVLGVSLRRAVVAEVLREMTEEWEPTTWMLGRGTLTAGAVGRRIQPWYGTVDNVFLNAVYERGLLGLALFVGAFLYFLIRTRCAAVVTVHWFAPITLGVAGLSFVWDAFSMFNILAVGSMAITMWHVESHRSIDDQPTHNFKGNTGNIA